MESGAVIEGFDVVEDGSASLGEGSEAMVIDQFVFEAAKEAFDKGIVVAVPLSTHRSGQAMLAEQLSVSGAGELGSAIGMDNNLLRVVALVDSHVKDWFNSEVLADFADWPKNLRRGGATRSPRTAACRGR